MKLRYWLLALLVFFFNYISAKENYIQYHKDIIGCEREFLFNANIPASIQAYKSVFKKYKKPFAKDCFIALQLACKIEDRESATFFFREAFKNGMEWGAISRSKAITHMLDKDAAFKSVVTSCYKEDSAIFGKTLNVDLRNEVFAMKQRDDSFKMRAQGFAYNDPVRIQRHNEHRAVVDSNTLRIAELTKKYSFLGDRLVGYMFRKEEHYRPEGSVVLNNYMSTLIDQLYYHHGCCYFMTEKELEKSLEEGGILPSMYASIYEWAYKDLKEGRLEMSLCKSGNTNQQKYYNICPVIRPWDRHKDATFVNKCREEIGLASVEHYTRKKEYEKETGMVLFFGMFSIN